MKLNTHQRANPMRYKQAAHWSSSQKGLLVGYSNIAYKIQVSFPSAKL